MLTAIIFTKKGKKMRFSSITIKKGRQHEFYHNDRTDETKHSIFTQENNEYSTTADKAFKEWKEDVVFFKKEWLKQHKKKLPKNTNLLLSAVINLNETHTLEDVNKVGEFLENYLGVKVYLTALHRDEGYVDDNGKAHINHHGHILMSGIRINKEGIIESVNKNLKRYTLRHIQEETAKILNMPRTPVKNKTRLDTEEYKIFANKHKSLVKMNNKLQKDNFNLNKEVNFYMKEVINKDKEIEELQTKNEWYKKRIKELKQQAEEEKILQQKRYEKAVRIIKKLWQKLMQMRKKREERQRLEMQKNKTKRN